MSGRSVGMGKRHAAWVEAGIRERAPLLIEEARRARETKGRVVGAGFSSSAEARCRPGVPKNGGMISAGKQAESV